MFTRNRLVKAIFLAAVLGTVFFGAVKDSRSNSAFHAKAISLDTKGEKYIQVLGGPPGNRVLRSGSIFLKPGETVGKHSTENYEELVIVLEGKGELESANAPTLPMQANFAYYCAPHTEHNVRNTGTGPLRYVYVVAKTT